MDFSMNENEIVTEKKCRFIFSNNFNISFEEVTNIERNIHDKKNPDLKFPCSLWQKKNICL